MRIAADSTVHNCRCTALQACLHQKRYTKEDCGQSDIGLMLPLPNAQSPFDWQSEMFQDNPSCNFQMCNNHWIRFVLTFRFNLLLTITHESISTKFHNLSLI
jgi:hypothetical protein